MISTELPLEQFLKKLSRSPTTFPDSRLNYFEHYKGLVNHLNTQIYNHISTGLATNSNEYGFYTSHDAQHFDEVVKFAGKLLQIDINDLQSLKITPYELYVLLVAIRIHDVGNIFGREEHEKKCFKILKDSLGKGADEAEAKIIANIAQAHGGKLANGDKDTIGILPVKIPFGDSVVRSQLLASIVRFADEICENRTRAANYLLSYNALPEHSKIYHLYAAAIKGNYIENNSFYINFKVKEADATKTWLFEGKQVYLIDIIYDRLEKMDRERRYCNNFSKELYTIDAIKPAIEIMDEDWECIYMIQIPELSDRGYPSDKEIYLKEQRAISGGQNVCDKLKEIRNGS